MVGPKSAQNKHSQITCKIVVLKLPAASLVPMLPNLFNVACNIEKLRGAWGRGYPASSINLKFLQEKNLGYIQVILVKV